MRAGSNSFRLFYGNSGRQDSNPAASLGSYLAANLFITKDYLEQPCPVVQNGACDFVLRHGGDMAQKLGHYTVIGEIGRGGMAVVYRAVQESLNRHVAIKELDLARFRSDPTALERFRLEARTAAALKHPNIVTIYDLWEEDEKAFIAMEFVDGAEVREVSEILGPLDPVTASLIVLDLCEALSFAHLNGMIHRDVKPANIMLSVTGEVKLMDFGIVAVSDSTDLTMAGQILGSPAYMAPEQIAGQNPGSRADIFSLGAVFYEILTGSKPFTGSNHIAIVQNVLHTDPMPPGETNPQVPDAISRIALRCLNKNPDLRFASMEELSTVLEMTLPLERTTRKAAVSNLVAGYRDLAITVSPKVESSPEDVTAPFPAAETTREHDAPGPSPRAGITAVHPLELDPPADLPSFGSVKEIATPTETSERDLVDDPVLDLMEIPEREEGPGQYIDDVKRRKPRSKLIWIVLFVLIISVGAWALLRGPSGQGILPDIIPGETPVTRLIIVGGSGATVFLNGENIGNAGTSVSFEVGPGPYLLELIHPDLGSRKFLGELKNGDSKTIEVDFGN